MEGVIGLLDNQKLAGHFGKAKIVSDMGFFYFAEGYGYSEVFYHNIILFAPPFLHQQLFQHLHFLLVNRLFPCAEIERVLQWRVAFPHHLYLAATDGLFAQEVGHDRETVSLAQAADDGTDVGHDVVGAEVRVFLEMLFPEVQQMPHVGGGAIPQSLLEEVDGLFHPVILQVKPQLRSIRMCPRDQHDAFFGKVLVLDVLLRAFVRGDDEVQQSVVKVLQHLWIFAKLDNQVEGQGGDILLQGVLKGLEAHAYADGVPLLLRTFVEMLLALSSFSSGATTKL